ncbi:hypothetical protein SuUB63_20420 [Streptococcus uberis]
MMGTQSIGTSRLGFTDGLQGYVEFITQTVNEILGSIMTSVRVRRKNGKTGLVFDHVAILRQEITSVSLSIHLTGIWVQNIDRIGKCGFHF